MTAYETFEHEADIGIRGFGETVEEAFVHTAMALYSVMVDLARVDQLVRKEVTVDAVDREMLLVEWLNGLLALSDIERLMFSRFQVVIEGDRLRGVAWGEPLDRVKHNAHVEVKGATYHMLSVKQLNGMYCAQCVVDV